MTILRTSRDGCWEIKSNNWGRYLAPTTDPTADTVITKEQLEGFELHDDIAPIPADLWWRWIQLCFEMTKRGTGDLEVSCRLLQNDAGEYRIVVPVQKVTGVSVRVDTFDRAVDIATGEVVQQWPPKGWRPVGSSHSHNTMDSFFSGTDDKYELGDPGLHIVVGNIDFFTGTFTMKASVTSNFRRFYVEHSQVVDSRQAEVTYHPAVLNVIELPNRTATTLPKVTAYKSALPAKDFTALGMEMEAVRKAAQTLVEAAKAKAVPYNDALSELAMEIDDMAYFTSSPAQPYAYEDPFYWNDDNIF